LLGDLQLKNRLVMAPLTRTRADNQGKVPNKLMAEYYTQRTGAGLIITEGTFVSEQGQGWYGAPGVYNEEQRAGWTRITEQKMDKVAVSEDAKSIVKSFYELGAQGDITSFAPRLADDFELFVSPYLPWGGDFNKAQYIALLPQVVSALDFTGMRYLSLKAEGGHVVALIDVGVQGTDRSIMISEHWDIRQDKAIRLLVAYFDPQMLLDQLKATSN
jgi:ketosteroid isomerase-like protein